MCGCLAIPIFKTCIQRLQILRKKAYHLLAEMQQESLWSAGSQTGRVEVTFAYGGSGTVTVKGRYA